MKTSFSLYKLIIFLFIITSCNSNKDNKNNSENSSLITINFSKKASYNLEDQIEDIQFIPLETTDESLFTEITQMEWINNELFIFDIRQNYLVVFDKYGFFKRKLNKKGQGPGEYSLTMSFFTDPDNNKTYIIDIDKKLICYDTNTFEFLFEKKTVAGINLAILENEKILWFNFLPATIKNDIKQSHILITDPNLEIISEAFPMDFESGYIMAPIDRFYDFNHDIYTFLPFDPIIYKCVNDSFLPQYELKFGNHKMPPLDFLKGSDNYLFELKNSNYVSYIHPFETNSFLLVSYFINNIKYIGLYNKNDKSSPYFIINSCEEKHCFTNKICGVYNESFISCSNFEELKTDTYCSIQENFIKLSENKDIKPDTPILISFKFKD